MTILFSIGNQSFARSVPTAILPGVLCFLIFSFPTFSTAQANEVPGITDYENAFDAPVLTLPDNATTRTHTTESPMAPLLIETESSQTELHYYVKMQSMPGCNTAAGSIAPDFVIPDCDIMDVFIRGGKTVTLTAPLGEYIIKYATGKDWYGYRHLFGPRGQYHKSDKTLTFETKGEGVRGYSIKLYRVQGGNLSMDDIRLSDF